MWCQGCDSVDYLLYHYDEDTFAWEAKRDHDIKKATFPKWYESFHKVSFHANQDGVVKLLSWGHDGMVAKGEVFTKELRMLTHWHKSLLAASCEFIVPITAS
jgi:hypothetical protein